MPRNKQMKSAPSKVKYKPKERVIGDEFRAAVKIQFDNFISDNEVKEFAFPSSLTADERAYIHELAKDFAFKSKSHGKGQDRFLTIYKKDALRSQTEPSFQLTAPLRQEISVLLKKFPLTNKEQQDLIPLTDREPKSEREAIVRESRSLGRLVGGSSQIPCCTNPNTAFLSFKKTLPIWPRRSEILQTINKNQVVVISGLTGSGKTTQVPQFILEDYSSNRKECRILCTQPRRISAVSVCERVSAERNESVGKSVGYQIRLESHTSPQTVLTYCTDGVLLRTLMGGDGILSTVTHVIIDEVHERNRYTDFLLIIIKEALAKYKSLKLILMSATMDTEVFTTYFNNCPVISVPGQHFDVEEFFLEYILECTGYRSTKYKPKSNKGKMKLNRKEFNDWSMMASNQREAAQPLSAAGSQPGAHSLSQESEDIILSDETIKLMDQVIQDAFVTGTEESFTSLAKVMLNEKVSIDYQHSATGVTPLMVAACRGDLDWIEEFLELGAAVDVKDTSGMTALDWASKLNQTDIVDYLEAFIAANQRKDVASTTVVIPELSVEHLRLLEQYYEHFGENENIDYDLVMALLTRLHANNDPSGGILVFIAGYEDIVTLQERISQCDSTLKASYNYVLYTLHSNMQTSDQKRVFCPAMKGVRKIILATNIAETSITIDDIVFVIDCGKVKEKSYDCMSGVCALRSTWISKSCAKQRRGRTGRTRPGKCYHLFSSVRYASLMDHRIPEILRLPLQELCLQTKVLAPRGTAIADFLARAIQPPSPFVIKTSLQLLKMMDALDAWEELTELGHRLLELPVEPRLGKMLLYSIFLKCLDPVLTIVSCLAYKDPFVLPSQPNLKLASTSARKLFSGDSLSDHMALLRAFQQWQIARVNYYKGKTFCAKNFLSSPTLEMIQDTRTQLLGQLRASGFVRSRGFSNIRDLNENSNNWAVVKAALCAGMYPNLARVDRRRNLLRTSKELKVSFHPSSTIRGTASMHETVGSLPSDWVIYEEMNRPGKFCNLRCCTVISPITVAIFAGPSRMPKNNLKGASTCANEMVSDSEEEDTPLEGTALLKLDDWITFRTEKQVVQLTLQLRQKWNALLLRRLRAPDKPFLPADDAVLEAVVHALTTEEKVVGLTQPEGVGERPRQGFYSEGFPKQEYENKNYTNNSVINQLTDLHMSNSSRRGDTSSSGAIKRPVQGPQNSLSEMNVPTRTFTSKSNVERNFVTEVGGAMSLNAPVQLLQRNDSVVDIMNYFIIKAPSARAIEFSLHHSAWAFAQNAEQYFMQLIKVCKVVVLLFSIQGSGHFQGYAILTGTELPQVSSQVWGEDVGHPLVVKWISQGSVPFQVMNPQDNNPVLTNDFQPLGAEVGRYLCTLLDKDPCAVAPDSQSARYYTSRNIPSRNNPRNVHHGRPIRAASHSKGPRHTPHVNGPRHPAQPGLRFPLGPQYF